MKRYQTTKETPIVNAILDLLVKNDYLVEYSLPVVDIRNSGGFETTRTMSVEEAQEFKNQLKESVNQGLQKTLANGMPIEVNIRNLAKHFLGVCEDNKLWSKELKAAVKEHGHDEVLTAFEQWAAAQGTYVGRKPVTQFLKNVGSNVGSVAKPHVTNPLLSRIETKIALVSNNTVFFTGDYRMKLAQLLKENGYELVEAAFLDFFQNVDDRSLPWAPRDFLQRAQIMVNSIQIKRQQEAQQKARVDQAYVAATESVDEIEEEEEL